MKKLLTFSLSCLFALGANAQLQSGMEDWHNLTSNGENLEAPDDWFGSDSLAIWAADYYGGGFISLSQQLFKESSVVNSGSFSARLETHESLILGIIPCIMANAQPAMDTANFDPGDPLGSLSYIGGTPVTERIAFVNAAVRYTTPDTIGDEHATISVQAVLAGQGVGGVDSVVGTGAVDVFETSGSGFENVGVAVNYIDADVVPDKIIIAFFSSGDPSVGVDGSVLYVDDVTMSTTSVKNTMANTANVKCYPNPATSVINITSTGNEPMTMQVFSLSGQVVSTKKFNGGTQTDLSHLVDGMYFYSIRNTRGEVLLHDKLVISK